MANTIKVKRSSVAGKVPTTGDLELGEIAINTYDGKMYFEKNDGTASVVQVGDVVGAASATDNALVRFDGTTGKLVQNGTITQDDDGNLLNVNSVGFDVTPGGTLPTAAGSMYWDSADGNQTLSLVMAGGNVTQQIGQEQYYRIKASSAITNGQAVMFTGTVGGSGALTGAPASGLTDATSTYFMGVATENIALNGWGYVTNFGLVRGINTTGGAESWVDGQILYYNPAVAGGLTKTVPAAPAAKIQVAVVVNAASGGSGSLFVRPTINVSLEDLNDVETASASTNDLLQYDGSKWLHKAPSTVTGIGGLANALTIGTGLGGTSYNGTSAVTITNAGVTSITGTTSQITASASTGGVTLSLPATINVNTSGNAATATSATSATSATTATNLAGGAANRVPYQTSAGATSFVVAPTTTNQVLTYDGSTITWAIAAGSGTVTSVAVSVPTGLAVSGSPVTTSGTIAIAYESGYSIPTTTSQTNWDTAYSDRLKWDGGSTGLVAATGRTSLGATTLGGNLFTITNPSAITFPRFNADNTVSALDAATFRTAIGAGTSSTTGTVTSIVAGTGLSGGTITTSGTIALANTAVTAGSYTNANITVDAQGRITAAANGSAGGVTSFSAGTTGLTPSTGTTGAITLAGTLAIANGGTGQTTRQAAMDALAGAVTAGQYLRGDGTDVVMSAIQAADVPTLNQNTTGSAATLTTGRTIAITGDLTYTSGSFNGSANVTGTGTLANSGVTAGSYTYASVTVDAKGRVTAASSGASPSAFPAGTVMLFRQTAAPTGWTKDTTNYNNHALRVVTGTASSGGTVAFTTAFASQTVSGSIGSTTATNQAATQGGSISSTTATNQATTAGGSISVSVSVGNTTLAESQMPSHTHASPTYFYDAAGPRTWMRGSYPLNQENYQYVNNTGGSGAHGHSGSGSGSFSGTSHNHTQDAHSHTFTGSSHNHTQDAHNHTFTGTAINMAVQYVDVIFATKD